MSEKRTLYKKVYEKRMHPVNSFPCFTLACILYILHIEKPHFSK